MLITRKEFLALKIPTAQTTVIGHRIKDYPDSICTTHRDCICCESFVCIKGNRERNDQIKLQLQESVYLLNKAEKDGADGEYGARRWVEHYRIVVDRLRQLCSILDDPRVPDGAVITLKPIANRLGGGPSRLLPIETLVKKRSA